MASSKSSFFTHEAIDTATAIKIKHDLFMVSALLNPIVDSFVFNIFERRAGLVSADGKAAFGHDTVRPQLRRFVHGKIISFHNA